MPSPRVCVFCGGRPVTKEHVFRRAWKSRFGHVAGQPIGTMRSIDLKASNYSNRPDQAFEMQVRRVCGNCNSGWMNQLDTDAQEFVFRICDARRTPGLDADAVRILRWWIVKTAIMRSLVDGKNPSIRDDEYRAIRMGFVPNNWHTFVSRTDSPVYLHANTSIAMGEDSRNPTVLVQQVSWALNLGVFIAIRSHMPTDAPDVFVDAFHDLNRVEGLPLVRLEQDPTRDMGVVAVAKLPTLFWVIAHPESGFASRPPIRHPYEV